MIFKIFISLLPVVFVVHLFATGFILAKNGINQDGNPPINKQLFFGSKYAVLLIWAAMLLEIWNINIPGSYPDSRMTQAEDKIGDNIFKRPGICV